MGGSLSGMAPRSEFIVFNISMYAAYLIHTFFSTQLSLSFDTRSKAVTALDISLTPKYLQNGEIPESSGNKCKITSKL